MKYEDLKSGLRRLGFLEQTNERNQTLFFHPKFDSIIALPKHNLQAAAPDFLLQNIRRHLDLKSILRTTDFDKEFVSVVKSKAPVAQGVIKTRTGEVWKQLLFPGWKQLRYKYALSSYGRIASYKHDVLQDGKLLNGSITGGYKTLNLHRISNNSPLYIHREMARLFHTKVSPNHKYVIHLNHNKLDNSSKNLKWVTLEKMIDHQQRSPAKLAPKKVKANRSVGLKLTASQVKAIKRTLSNQNRQLTIKKLAEKYNVSAMTMYRIKGSSQTNKE